MDTEANNIGESLITLDKKASSITVGDENVSLQDAFAKFRAQKTKERKLMKAYKESSNGQRSQEFKE